MEASFNGDVGPVLIVGFGQFGRALGQLCREAGLETWAVDPSGSIPDEFRAREADPVAGARLVVLAVPPLGFEEALSGLLDHLSSAHLVVDVSSVRAGPDRTMRAALGPRVPWIGTHPLFGPTSIALGERPLTAVVCPNDQHPDAADRAERFYRALGCSVLREPAEQHDRRMAYTHALAFYLAKGLLDMGVPSSGSAVPPSFRSITRMMESVRSDAGHLSLAIQLNPFAGEARAELLSALSRLHDDLEDFDPDVSASSSGADAFRIPDLGDAAPALRQTRDLIDEIDHELIEVIGRRVQLARRAGSIKKQRGVAIRDPERERTLLERRKAWAEAEGLDPVRVQRLFEGLITLSRRAQEDE